MEKIAIFVDVQNIYYTVKNGLAGKFDYNYFWKKVVNSNCEVVVAYAYAIERDGVRPLNDGPSLGRISVV